MKHVRSAAKLAALACCMSITSAHADQWNFTFHNLHHTYFDLLSREEIDYGYTSLSGSFTAFDDDHDGVISTSEVDSLYFGGGIDPYDVSTFTYSGGNQLTFEANGYRAYVNTSSGYSGGSGGYLIYYSLNSSSFITVNAAPVPEAASSAMLLMGLLTLGGVRCARSRKERSA